jgi:hypothetical protein
MFHMVTHRLLVFTAVRSENQKGFTETLRKGYCGVIEMSESMWLQALSVRRRLLRIELLPALQDNFSPEAHA